VGRSAALSLCRGVMQGTSGGKWRAKRLGRASPKSGERRSLRKIAAETRQDRGCARCYWSAKCQGGGSGVFRTQWSALQRQERPGDAGATIAGRNDARGRVGNTRALRRRRRALLDATYGTRHFRRAIRGLYRWHSGSARGKLVNKTQAVSRNSGREFQVRRRFCGRGPPFKQAPLVVGAEARFVTGPGARARRSSG
jgi:hypothetical protein